MENKTYIVVVQCDIAMERCSGYFCEQAYAHRTGRFSTYPADRKYRTLYMTCGGCCGRAVHRKLGDLTRTIKTKEDVEKARIVVHLASCITHDNFHGPKCPHLDYLKTMIGNKAGLDIVEGTHISKLSEKRRGKGVYEL
jgi:predicted metal-binding protein